MSRIDDVIASRDTLSAAVRTHATGIVEEPTGAPVTCSSDDCRPLSEITSRVHVHRCRTNTPNSSLPWLDEMTIWPNVGATARVEHHPDGGADPCIQSHAACHARVVSGPSMYFCSCAA